MSARGDVYLIALDPTLGHEIAKTRPGVIVSPDEMNRTMGTVIIAPLTTRGKPYPMRVSCRFRGRIGRIALDQMRAVDKIRLVKKLGRLRDGILVEALQRLVEMFWPGA